MNRIIIIASSTVAAALLAVAIAWVFGIGPMGDIQSQRHETRMREAEIEGMKRGIDIIREDDRDRRERHSGY